MPTLQAPAAFTRYALHLRMWNTQIFRFPEAQFKVRTKVIEADFTGGDEIYDHIEKELMGFDVSVLVNNVGMSYPHPEYFLSLPDKSKVSIALV